MRQTITLLLTCTLMLAPLTSRADALRDSIMNAVLSIEDDSIRLRQMFICAQNHMDEMWTLELLDSGRNDAARQKHVLWELSFMGSKVRWTHHHHDWAHMDQYLREQREASFRLGSVGNYMSQIAQSVIVLDGVGMFEQAWKYIEQIKKDIEAAGPEGEKNRAYIYLAEADYYMQRGEKEKSRDTYVNALINCPNVSPSQRISIHNSLISVYAHLEQYALALDHADSVIALYYSFSADHQKVPNSRSLLVECELNKAGIYSKLNQFDKMRECIERAEQSAEGVTQNLIGNLYYWWHRYHYLTGNYEKSLEYADMSAQSLRDDHYHEQATERELDKVMPLWALGHHSQALDHYVKTLRKLDELHQSMIASQQEYLSQISEMLRQEEKNLDMQMWASRIIAIIAMLLLLAVVVAALYAIYARRTLKQNYRTTQRKLEEARAADQAKERFMHDITSLINDPLQCVVSDAKRLATDSSLTAEQQQAMLNENKEQVERLMTLVNNVLDLSRLEAGMMKYNATEVNLIQLIEENARAHNNLYPDSRFEVKNEVGEFTLNIDAERFSAMLETLYAAPVDHHAWKTRNIVIQLRRGGDGSTILVITGSYYAQPGITEAEQMTNRINGYFLKDFGATYYVGYGAITIVFPE